MEIVNNALFLEKILNKLININTAMLKKKPTRITDLNSEVKYRSFIQ